MRAVSTGADSETKKMAIVGLKMGLKNSQQLRMVLAASFRCIKVPSKLPYFDAMGKANSAFNAAVHGNPNHTEGSPDCYSLAGVLLECKKAVDEEKQKLIDAFFEQHPKGSVQMFRVVKCFRWEKMFSSEWKRIFLVLSPECKGIEDLIVQCMINAGGVELIGMAPKVANEREAQALLDAAK